MGAVPVLIALAAVGVDYGWQPDGTTSPRGDNVEYIVQIPPHQLQQVSSVGEITSTIDPSIQGRVSRIVVRVGTGALPKDGGKLAPALDAAQSVALAEALAKADANAAVPIPEITSPLASTAAPGQTASGSQALMKPDPDPQAGGYAFPESSGGAANSGTTARTNPAVSTDPVTPGHDSRWGDFGGGAASASTTSQGSAASGTGATARPSTDPVTPPAGGTQQLSWPTATTTSTPPAGAAAATSTSGNRPTDPSDPNWSGYGTTPNFGTLPPGMSPPPGIVRPPASGSTAAAAQDSDFQRTATTSQPAATTAQDAGTTASALGLSRDAAGNLIDRLGRTVNALGQVIDPETGFLVDATGNLVDEFGRQIDRLGRLLPGRDATATPPSGAATLQPPLPTGTFAQQGGPAPAWGQTPQTQLAPATPPFGTSTPYPPQQAYNTGNSGFGAQAPPYAQSPPYAQAPAYAQQQNQRDPRQAQAPGSRPGGFYDEDNFRSPSDSRPGDSRTADDRSSAPARVNPQDRDAPATAQVGAAAPRARTVAAQPFFLFLLLISGIGNAYLIYETGNLRRKFRSMVANVRAAKLSAPSAN